MKVLQILFPCAMGGVERIASQLLESNEKIDCYIGIDSKYYEAFVSYVHPDVERVIPLDCSSIRQTLHSVKKCIKTVNPNIVHTHARKEMVYVCLCLKRNIIHIRTQHMEEKPKIPVCILEKWILRKKVDLWIATSKRLANTYLSDQRYIKSANIDVIYNGASEGEKRVSYDISKKYCIVCRISKQKGIDILVRAVASLDESVRKNIRIDIWGEGEELKAVMDLIKQLRVENIFFYKGTTIDPKKIVVEYDSLLMPSRYEGLPLTMLECMSTGTPVATHDVGCVNEFIESGKNGWIINDAFTWQDFFMEDLTTYEYERMCKNVVKTYNELFSLEKMKNSYFDVYKKMALKGKRKYNG